MNTDEVKLKIRGFLETFIQDDDFEDDEDIFAQGLVSSLMAMQLVLFLEKSFDKKFSNEDLNLSHFRSVDAMVELLQSKT
jgi:acyl carrier protein